MIRYHGGPCTPIEAALELWSCRHALISFAYPAQIDLVAKHSHSFVMDNGAFSAWEEGRTVDWDEYARWVGEYCQHPGFDYCFIPDVIDGDEAQNDELIKWWESLNMPDLAGCPVWHLHESLDRLRRLVDIYPRVAFGSSGEFSEPGTSAWWSRMCQAMEVACDENGRPLTRLHGLRQMDPILFSHIPYAAVDSARIARKSGLDDSRPRRYRNLPTKQAALMMAFDADHHKSAARWTGSSGVQAYMEFY